MKPTDTMQGYVDFCRKEYFENNRVPLVLFSGGLDSTYLLYALLKYVPVDTLFITANQGEAKIVSEVKAREKIIKYIESISAFKVRNKISSDISGNEVRNYIFAQPLSWVYGGITQYREEHSNVAIGYVLGDEAAGELNDIRTAWDILSESTKYEVRPLCFPLRYIRKTDIISELPEKLRKLIWVCELPVEVKSKSKDKTYKACGKCPACVRLKAEKFKLELLNN